MSEKTIRQAIVDAIVSVESTGEVYDHVPWASTFDVVLDKFRIMEEGKQLLRGFTVSMVEMSQTGKITQTSSGTDIRSYSYEVLGFQSVKTSTDEVPPDNRGNDSENQFLEIVLDVMAELDKTNLSTFRRPRCQLDNYRADMVGSVLSHVATIVIPNVEEEVDCD